MPVIITARSHSEDPAQEHLRERKAVWNKACSAFIARLNAFKPALISFKRGLNGRGDAKAGLPISTIKEPLPAEIGGYLGLVSGEFNELAAEFATLVSEANGIVQEQSQYASHRRQTHASPDNNALVVEGSNPITRYWAKLPSLFSQETKQQKLQRLSALSLSHTLFKNLVEFEDHILSKDMGSFKDVLNSYFRISNNLNSLKVSVIKLFKLKGLDASKVGIIPADKSPDTSSDTSSDTPPDANKPPIANKPSAPPAAPPAATSQVSPPSPSSIHKLKDDVIYMGSLGLSKDDMQRFLAIYHQNKLEKDKNKIDIIADILQEKFDELFDKFKKQIEIEIEQKLPENISLDEIRNLQKNASLLNLDLTKLSSHLLSRLWNKYKHKRGKDPSSAARIEVYNIIREMKIIVDKIMNLLENKDFNSEELNVKITELLTLILTINEPLHLLNMLYKDKYYEPGSNKRNVNILDPAGRFFNKQIQQDIDKPG